MSLMKDDTLIDSKVPETMHCAPEPMEIACFSKDVRQLEPDNIFEPFLPLEHDAIDAPELREASLTLTGNDTIDHEFEEGEIVSEDDSIVVRTAEQVTDESDDQDRVQSPPPLTLTKQSIELKLSPSRVNTPLVEKKAQKRAAANGVSNEDDRIRSVVEISVLMATEPPATSRRKRVRSRTNHMKKLKPDDIEDVDEYEMLYMRGGSPPPQQQQHDEPYLSGESYSSHRSYEERPRQRKKDRRKKRVKRRRFNKAESEKLKSAEAIADTLQARGPVRHPDEYEILYMRGGSPPPPPPEQLQQHDEPDQARGDSYSSHEERRRRHKKDRRERVKRRLLKKVESQAERPHLPQIFKVCKFYLTDCCAKREECLYMHSDFPCKHYYFGMKNHIQDNCKFSHGEPLTDELRNILLNHLEMAPKEILGDFPRINREKALIMINKQNQILLREHGIEPPATTASTLKNKPPDNDYSKSDGSKPRRTRWCDTAKSAQLTGKTETSELSATSFLSLTNLEGVLSNEQIEKLTASGIEKLDQMNQLTFVELKNFGLSTEQIQKIQLNSMNMLKFRSPAGNVIADTITTTTVDTAAVKARLYRNFGIGGDMLLQPTDTKSGNKDVDMRMLPASGSINTDLFGFQQQPNVLHSNSANSKPMNIATTDINAEDSKQLAGDFSICAYPDTDCNNDETNNQLVIVEEPAFEIDGSWYSDEEDDKPNPTEKTDTMNSPAAVIYDTLYPTAIMNKIDLSTLVMQFNSDSNSSTDTEAERPAENSPSKLVISNEFSQKPNEPRPTIASELSIGFMVRKDKPLTEPLRDSRKLDATDPNRFTRYVRESSAPTAATVESSSTAILNIVATETSSGVIAQQSSLKSIKTHSRSSIYESELSDSSTSETESTGVNTKDKDMRISSLFVKKANLKGDIDYRLPFQPVNYMPVKEIQASIAHHDPIPYGMRKVKVPKPDYSDIRRNISTMEEILDPRLRRILRLSNSSSASDLSDDVRVKQSTEIPAANPRLDRDPRRRIMTDQHTQHKT